MRWVAVSAATWCRGMRTGPAWVLSRAPDEHWDVVRISLPPALARYVVHKGSVTVDGVSLTVLSGLGDASGSAAGPEPWFEVSLIPTTLELTTLGRVQPGGLVNLEVDVIAKYVERLLGRRSGTGCGGCRATGRPVMTTSEMRPATRRAAKGRPRTAGPARRAARAGRAAPARRAVTG